MRTRKIFFHEEGIYDGTSRLPEQREKTPTEFVSINDSYDEYPVKEPVAKTETSKIDDLIDVSLADEYHLQSHGNQNSSTSYDNQDIAVLLKESKI